MKRKKDNEKKGRQRKEGIATKNKDTQQNERRSTKKQIKVIKKPTNEHVQELSDQLSCHPKISCELAFLLLLFCLKKKTNQTKQNKQTKRPTNKQAKNKPRRTTFSNNKEKTKTKKNERAK